MTIAAAFSFPDGVLFCADTQHTSNSKLESTKLFRKEYPSRARSLFAVCGDVHPAKMLLQRCERRLAEFRGRITSFAATGLVESVVAETYEKHFSHSPREVETALFAGIYCPGDRRIILLQTLDTSVNQLFGYDVIGTGEDLGHYLIRDFYQAIRNERSQLEPMFLKSVGALKEIKEYVDGCGKASEAVWLGSNGALSEVARIKHDTKKEWNEALVTLKASNVPVPKARQFLRRSKGGPSRRPASRG
jgi:hypothetical protein